MGAIVLFDGVCKFCNGSVNFIIDRDQAGYFQFAPIQSEAGSELMEKYVPISPDIDSIILIEDEHAYTHSTAALRIARRLGGIWKAVYALIIVPRPVRDLFYRLFAKYRYRIFGRTEECMLPTPEVRARFLG
jgi:predicted DCC family thiol-disulfide oxidoreductase YuxK